MQFPGGVEWLVIFIVIIILFGSKKLPELARGLGLGIREFKKAKDEIKNEVNSVTDKIEEDEKEDEGDSSS